MRLNLKRGLFDENGQYHDRGYADVSDSLIPPRDAEVWDGDKFVPVPVTDKGEVDVDALEATRGDVPPEPEDEDDFSFSPTPKRGRRKK